MISPSVHATRTFGLSWPLLIGVAAFFIPVLASGVLNDGDTYWHIASGQWIAEHHQVPTQDPFSFSMPGAPWSAQEWGAELLFAWLYRHAGWSGLVLLVSSSFALTLAYLTRFLLARIEPIYAILFTCLAAALMLSVLLARPHVVAWPLTALWVGRLVQANENRTRPAWWLLGLLVVWTNFHASFVLGYGIAVLIAADAVLCAPSSERRGVFRAWAVFLVAAGACVLLNPQGYRAILYGFSVMHMKTELAVIQEWQSPNFQQPQALALWLFLIMGLAFAGRVRLSPARSILVLGLFYMSLQHQRYVALVGLISPFILALPLSRLWRQQAPTGNDAATLDRWFQAFAAPAGAVTACLLTLLCAGAAVAALHVRHPEPAPNITPTAALDALHSAGGGQRILNAYGMGGYLIFRGIPVFIDGRGDMYGDQFVSSYFKALSLTGDEGALEELLAKYCIDSTLLGPNTPGVQILDRLPGWRRVYSDKVAIVHIRQKETPCSTSRNGAATSASAS